MKQRLQGLIAGIAIGAICTGSVVLASTGTRSIEVLYDNIKVYKDNVLCELKDSNGKVIEPFIYEGTTYMPVRGTANLAGMDVTWDGPTNSVYLWDDMVAEGTYLLDVCPPYDKRSVDTYLVSNGNSFTMAGEKYSNGIKFNYDGFALFNLNSRYSTIECTVGHTGSEQTPKNLFFLVDGKTVMEVELEPECLPKTISIPVNYGLQLKIVTGDEFYSCIGIGNMIVK